MVGRPVVTTPPTSEPIALAFVKQMLRTDAGDTSQDDYLNLLISVARETAEQHTTRCYMLQGYREFYDGFPGHHFPLSLIDGFDGDPAAIAGFWGARDHARRRHHHYFELSRSPLRALAQIQYKDLTGATQALDPSQYFLNNKQDPAQITRVPETLGGLAWPVALREVNSVWIDYTVGYGANFTASFAQNAAVLTAVSGYTFTSADVGQPVTVPGAGAAGAALVTSVQSVDVSGNATLAASASTTVTAAMAYVGQPIPRGDFQAMLLMISHWYENRTPIQQGAQAELPYAIEYLLDKNRVYYQP